jgi:hypothetical protein
VELAAARFDHVVLDVPRVPDPLVLRALDQASRVCLVTLTSLPGLHGARRLATLLRDLGLPQSRLELVVNRADRSGELAAGDLRRALGFAQAREIPDSAQAVEQAIDRGMPILLHAPRDPVARALAQWAAQLAPLAAPAPAHAPPGARETAGAAAPGWLRGLALGSAARGSKREPGAARHEPARTAGTVVPTRGRDATRRRGGTGRPRAAGASAAAPLPAGAAWRPPEPLAGLQPRAAGASERGGPGGPGSMAGAGRPAAAFATAEGPKAPKEPRSHPAPPRAPRPGLRASCATSCTGGCWSGWTCRRSGRWSRRGCARSCATSWTA